MEPMQAEERKSSTAALVIAWLVVGLPLLWGIQQTVMKALALFH
jgi:hypothetical protein